MEDWILALMEIDITINLYTYHCIASMFSCVCVCVCVCVCAMCIDSLGTPFVKAPSRHPPAPGGGIHIHCPPFWACVCPSIRKSPPTHLPFPTLTCRTFPNVDLSPPRYPPMIDWYLTCNNVVPL